MTSQDTDCIICAEPLTGTCSVTRCGHMFHDHCLQTWFAQKLCCPLCKTEGTSVRKLHAPERADVSAEALARAMVEGPPSPQAEAKLRAQLVELAQEQSDMRTAQRNAEQQSKLKRTHVDGLQSELLHVKRRLHEAQKKERQSQAQLRSMAREEPRAAELWQALEQTAADGPCAATAPQPSFEGLAGRDAVIRQSKQLRWRAQELKALEEKVRALRARLDLHRAVHPASPEGAAAGVGHVALP